jgi:periodic tryptophan protein 2
VKLWNASSGFCFITFGVHVAPITGVKFIGNGNGRAVISSSLDGTIRAHDLLRYKNFRTMTSPTAVQFTSLAVESTGSVVCAGSLDPFNIYVWSLQTGSLLDVLAGHEGNVTIMIINYRLLDQIHNILSFSLIGPIACLDFSSSGSILASGSWDGTLKLWDVYKNTCIETMEHGCDVLAIAFRPDGKQICTATTNGNLAFWDTESGNQIKIIEGRRDISGGRLSTDMMTAQNSERSKYFTSLAYTSDGTCVLAGGRSRFVCIYCVESSVLVKKFQLSHNRSLEGVLDELRSDKLVDGVLVKAFGEGESDDEFLPESTLPGTSKGASDGSRITKPEILTSAVRFSPSGREWAAATTQGLQVLIPSI